MDLSTVANVATALTVITGVGFGLVEAQRSRRAREERAAYAAVQALLSQAWMKSMIVVHSIPDGSSASAIEANAEVLNAAHSVGVILEGLGYSVYARIVPLRVAADLVGGTVRLAWRKLKPYIEEERRRSGSQKTFEWFQWLAIQLEDIHLEKQTCRSARRKRIEIGNLEVDRPLRRTMLYRHRAGDCSIHPIVQEKVVTGPLIPMPTFAFHP